MRNYLKKLHVSRSGVVFFTPVLMLFLVYLLFYFMNWEINPTPRVSLGRYVFICNMNPPKSIQKGDNIAFRFPTDTPYFKKGDKFIKIAGCMPGDKLTIDDSKNYFCNDYWLGKALDTDSNGKPAVHFTYSGAIPDGKVFVFGTHVRSYDSRYWGFVDIASIEGKCYGY